MSWARLRSRPSPTSEDDGVGFNVATTNKGSGLTNMIDRLDALGGDVQVISSPGTGTRLCGSLPIVSAAVPV
jgi:signal transduction histidine kinase